MYYSDDYFSQPNPFVIQQPQQQQQGGMQINPMQALQAYQMFGGGGAAGGGGGGMSGLGGMLGGSGAASGGGAAASGGATGGGSAASGAGTALAASPIGWIGAALLAQGVADNQGISTWGDALRGTSGREAGDHFLDQWGVGEDSKVRDIAGVAGWGSGGGILNPSYLPGKIFD